MLFTDFIYKKINCDFLKKNIDKIIVLFLIIISIGGYRNVLFNDYIIYDDARQHVYWMAQFQDPELFQNDILTDYARQMNPWPLFRAMYFIGLQFFDIVFLHKLIGLITLSATLILLYFFVKSISDRYTGLFCTLLFLNSETLLRYVSGGLARSFTYLLLILFSYSLLKHDLRLVIISIGLQVLFYPLMSLVYLLTFLIFQTSKSKIELKGDKTVISLFITILILTGITLQTYFSERVYSETYSRYEFENNVDILNNKHFFGPMGQPDFKTKIISHWRKPIQLIGKIQDFFNSTVNIRLHFFKSEIFSFLLILVFLVFIHKKNIPTVFMYLTISSCIMFFISKIFFFKLYFPARYLRYSISFVSLVFFSILVWKISSIIKNEGKKFILFLICYSFMVLFLGDFIYDIHKDASEYRDVFLFLKDTPKDSVILAKPSLADFIPLISKRVVFVNYELFHPFYPGYHKILDVRANDEFSLIYAEDLSKAEDIMVENNIDYLVLDDSLFSDISGFSKTEKYPFNKYINLYSGNGEEHALKRSKLRGGYNNLGSNYIYENV